MTYKAINVPGTGFEPAHLAAPPPEDGASTNFATRAGCKYRVSFHSNQNRLHFFVFNTGNNTPASTSRLPAICKAKISSPKN